MTGARRYGALIAIMLLWSHVANVIEPRHLRVEVRGGLHGR